MGTKYSTISISGYNATPPADDGSATEANRTTWAKHKTKLADPIKTLSESINTALVAHLDESVVDKAIAFTTTTAEHKRTINVTAAATISLGDAGTMAAGYIVTVKNSHTAAITVDLATGADTLDGTVGGSVSLQQYQAKTFIVNASADGYLQFQSSNIDGVDGTFTGDVAITGGLTATGGITGNLAFDSGNGIDFSATGDGSGTATSEILDDYEEGTWTPSVVGGVTGADCSYVKVGRMVTIGGTISGMVLSGAGGVLIAGLPYAPATSSKHCCPILAQNLGKTGYESFTGWLDSDGTEISFWGQNLGVQDGATWAQLVHNDLGVSHKIFFTMSYFAAT